MRDPRRRTTSNPRPGWKLNMIGGAHGPSDRRSDKTGDDPVTRRAPTAELLAWAAAVLSAVAAAAGLFFPTFYLDAPFWTEQAHGIDLATLLLAVPILVVSLWLSRRASAF